MERAHAGIPTASAYGGGSSHSGGVAVAPERRSLDAGPRPAQRLVLPLTQRGGPPFEPEPIWKRTAKGVCCRTRYCIPRSPKKCVRCSCAATTTWRFSSPSRKSRWLSAQQQGCRTATLDRKLMQAAFNPDAGALTDRDADKGERVGLMDLFSGGIGYCRKSTRPPGPRFRPRLGSTADRIRELSAHGGRNDQRIQK